jgi:hypothetical protein
VALDCWGKGKPARDGSGILNEACLTLEKVTEKIDKISVFGGLDAVLKDLVKIR